MNNCTALNGWFAVLRQIKENHIRLNPIENKTLNVIMGPANLFSAQPVIAELGAGALIQGKVFDNGMSAGLPNNQWMLEVESWFATSLAGLQQWGVEYVSGPSQDEVLSVLLSNWTNDGTPETKAICGSQKIFANGYQNFSVLGLCLILIIGGIIILSSLCLESLVASVQKKMNRGQARRYRWIADSNFQLQRMKYEKSGYGEWKGHMDTVPLCISGKLESRIQGGL